MDALAASWHLFLSERPLPTDDPRPDLSHDSALWAALLALAHGNDNDELLGNLNGLRCMGAGLTMHNGRVELWHRRMSQAEYDADRAKYLVPHAAELVKLLGEVKA